MRLHEVIIAKHQLGWTCDIWFTVETAEQFTDETHSVVSCSPWMVVAVWRAWRGACRKAKALRAKPGEREAKGWV